MDSRLIAQGWASSRARLRAHGTCPQCNDSFEYADDVIVTYGRFHSDAHWGTFRGSRKDGATRLYHPSCYELDRGKLPPRASRS